MDHTQIPIDQFQFAVFAVNRKTRIARVAETDDQSFAMFPRSGMKSGRLYPGALRSNDYGQLVEHASRGDVLGLAKQINRARSRCMIRRDDENFVYHVKPDFMYEAWWPIKEYRFDGKLVRAWYWNGRDDSRYIETVDGTFFAFHDIPDVLLEQFTQEHDIDRTVRECDRLLQRKPADPLTMPFLPPDARQAPSTDGIPKAIGAGQLAIAAWL